MGIVTGAVAAYLVGCVPTARAVRHVARGRPWEPWAVLAADLLKGVVAIVLFSPVTSIGQSLTVTAVVAGDQWPIFGEGSRSGLPVLVAATTALTPVALAVWGLFWGVGFAISGYFTVAQIIATIVLPVGLGLAAGWPLGLSALPACLMVLERHRRLLRSLLRGAEAKHYWRAEV